MIDDPVFIVGTERSGSNLLRLILNENAAIAIPHPPHLMRDLSGLLHRYGDLADDRNFRRLIGDAVTLVELHFAPWDTLIDRDAIFAQARARELYCVYAEIHEQYLRSRGKARWGCKSTFMIRHIGEIVRFHRNPRIVHLVRDGRDVAVSARDSVFNRFHPHYVARLWAEEQRLALRWRRELPPERFTTLRYEDLIADPERRVRDLCAFLGVDYSPGMLRFFESRAATELAALSASWQNVARPVLSANSGRYRTALSAEDVFEFERVAGAELGQFGYPLENDPGLLAGARPGTLDLVRFFLLENTRAARVQLEAALKDRNAMRRWKKRLFLRRIAWLK